jgi:hypothetical protein
MLEHPWLNMPDQYSFKMTDLEYKKYQLRSTIETVKDSDLQKSKPQSKFSSDPRSLFSDFNVGDLVESDSEINGADREDNLELESDSDSESISLSGDNKEGV